MMEAVQEAVEEAPRVRASNVRVLGEGEVGTAHYVEVAIKASSFEALINSVVVIARAVLDAAETSNVHLVAHSRDRVLSGTLSSGWDSLDDSAFRARVASEVAP
jgi:hypothetical protein